MRILSFPARFLFALLVLAPVLLFPAAAGAGTPPAAAASSSPGMSEGLALLADGRACLYNGPFAQAREKLERARAVFLGLAAHGSGGERHLAFFHAAEASLELGTWYESQGDNADLRARAAEEFAAAELQARQSMQLKPDFPGAAQMLAQAYMRQTDYKGTLYTMTKGLEAKRLIDTALRLDSKSAANHLAAGLWYQGAPAMVGGSLNKALEHFKKAAELAETDFERFYAQVWTGLILNKMKQYPAAEKAFTQALAIYPQSEWARNGLRAAQAGARDQKN
ncbi:MAG: hypothetical protein IMW99_06655 [Firmicutes bacterium]|nr:hypothetical protein [Bacillota bacterium]